MTTILNEKVQDRILSQRQKDGMDGAEDPSKYNVVLTERHGRRLIHSISVADEIIHAGVDNLTELRTLDVPTNKRADRMLVLVEDDPTPSYNGLYRYDEQAVAVESLPFVVEPDDSVGRWIQIAKSNVFHNSLGSLQGGTTAERYHHTQGQNSASAGSFGTPGPSNTFVTETDPRVGGLLLFEAEEVIAAYSAVYISGSLKIRKADPSLQSKMPALGIVTSTTGIGLSYPVYNEGYVSNPGWSFTPNKELFVGAGGVITATVPTSGYYLSVGRSVAATAMHLNIGKLIRL